MAPQRTPAKRILQPKVAEKHGGICARRADHLRTSLPDDSVLVCPTVAQKPEPGGPVKSIDMAPSRHWQPTIPENACMVSDAFPSLVSRIVAIWSPGCSLFSSRTDFLSLPPSGPSFPLPPHRCDDDHHHCVKQRKLLHVIRKHSFRPLLPRSCVFQHERPRLRAIGCRPTCHSSNTDRILRASRSKLFSITPPPSNRSTPPRGACPSTSSSPSPREAFDD